MDIRDYPHPAKITKDSFLGYEHFFDSAHPMADAKGRVWYHRHVAAVREGRWLSSNEHVHHIDGDRANNVPENLVVMTNAEHAKAHNPGRRPTPCPVCAKLCRTKYCSPSCSQVGSRVVDRPTKDRLEELMSAHSMVSLGKMFGVSDKAIAKWAKAYGIVRSRIGPTS